MTLEDQADIEARIYSTIDTILGLEKSIELMQIELRIQKTKDSLGNEYERWNLQ